MFGILSMSCFMFYPVCERPDVYKVEVTRTFVRFMVDFLCMFYPVCERPDGYKVEVTCVFFRFLLTIVY